MMMGYAERANNQRKLDRYRVSRWTSFSRADETSERRDHLERIAGIAEGRLRQQAPDSEASVTVVATDGGESQLLFQITVRGENQIDARQRAMQRFERAMSAKITASPGRRVRLALPWSENFTAAVMAEK